MPMLYDPARHEPLAAIDWNEHVARDAIAHIVRGTEAAVSAEHEWPMHPDDVDGGDSAPALPLYHGACGVIWTLQRDYRDAVEPLFQRTVDWLRSFGCPYEASYLMGVTSVRMLEYWLQPMESTAHRLAGLIESNIDNPTRELMW